MTPTPEEKEFFINVAHEIEGRVRRKINRKPFKISTKPILWKERTLIQKLCFWKTYQTALNPVTNETLHNL